MTALAAVVASITLPLGAFWSNVAPAHGKLVVWGYPDRGALCSFLTVDPTNLRSSLARRDCSQTGRLTPRHVWNGRTKWAQVRVAGTLALRYQDSSTGRPVWAWGGGSLWVYDVATPRGPQLVRFSLGTGRLLQRIRFPVQLWRPVIAANADGAWLMAATNGGTSVQAQSLYHVAPGSSHVSVVQHGARAAFWITGYRHTLWLETVTGFHTFKLWRYDGTRGRLLWTRHSSTLYSTSYGGGALWGVSARYCGTRVRALRIDARTGALTTVATLPLLDCNQFGAGAFFRGWFWFVDGDKLFRVR